MEYVYEVELAGRTVKVLPEVWRQVSEYVLSNQWFYIVYMGKNYKYYKTHSFYDRPAKYMFKLVDEETDEEIKYIYL